MQNNNGGTFDRYRHFNILAKKEFLQMKKELESYTIQLEIPVRWSDMDAFQHVNNVIYLQWGEMGRIEYIKQHITGDFTDMTLGPILARQDCRYIFPVIFPDTVLVGVKVSEIQEDRIIFEIKIFTKKHNRICAIIYNTVMAYDFVNHRKSEIPIDWIMKIQDVEQ